MDGVIDLARARELVGNAALWPRVRDFLWDFAPQVHASWLESLENLELLEQQAQASGLEQRSGLVALDSPRVKSWLLKELGVEPCFHDFPKEDGSRLLLLDGATLEKVVQWLGALACADELRRVTDGATVRALRSALPGVYPDVFGYTAYFRGNDFQRRDAETQRLEERVPATGLGLLLSAVSGLPTSLVSRLTFKLPKKLCASPLLGHPLRGQASPGGYAPLRFKDNTAQVAISVVLKLFKLKFPEAYSLCCS